MKIDSKGLKLIKEHEGLRLDAYLCPANVWTIGYGHTATARQGMRITRAQAEDLLRQDVEWAEREVNSMGLSLSQNQFNALVSLVFNIGAGAFRRSTLRRLAVANPANAAIRAEFLRWDKAAGRVLPGLARRRAEEADMYFSMA